MHAPVLLRCKHIFYENYDKRSRRWSKWNDRFLRVLESNGEEDERHWFRWGIEGNFCDNLLISLFFCSHVAFVRFLRFGVFCFIYFPLFVKIYLKNIQIIFFHSFFDYVKPNNNSSYFTISSFAVSRLSKNFFLIYLLQSYVFWTSKAEKLTNASRLG